MNLKSRAKTLSPVLRIGKNGINENVLAEIDKLLEKRELIKIKVLNNCSTPLEELIETSVQETGAQLISSIGKVFVLYRKN